MPDDERWRNVPDRYSYPGQALRENDRPGRGRVRAYPGGGLGEPRGDDRGASSRGGSTADEGGYGNDYAVAFYGADQGYGGGDRRVSGAWRGSGERRGWSGQSSGRPSRFADRPARYPAWEAHPEGQAAQHHRGRGPKGYKRSDERIREDVCERLTDDALIDASEIEIRVSDGEVTLAGTVGTRNERRRAEDVVEEVSGVTHVQNNLRVQQTAATGGVGLA